ncbi:aspartate aminotransferase family protein [Marinobacter halodurans]|uniref:Aspartate aminotransferase family protein n=1 Tax=Marinobacter halodurans TaxID=2528979 RepID=A0ABY1ZKD2_9GAMM|nr:aspartate aminotransferase family protein [Marinobacter halodurans]TBW55986.1 aspartate aminotransferase family protein [Marinobacter halodurans]
MPDTTTTPTPGNAIRDMDARHHLHPFSDTRALNQRGARVIARAEGVYVWDADDNQLIDGMAGLWCVNIGYGRQELIDAAVGQMQTLPYYNTFFQSTHAPVTRLAKAIAGITPGDLDRVFFANSGSEAIDTVIRMVRHYWTLKGKPYRKLLIARENAYHGSTLAGASLGGMGHMHRQCDPMLPGIHRIGQPYWYGEADGLSEEEFGLQRARELEEKILEVGPDNVAAFIGEPIQGAGGVIVPPRTYWPEIQRICRKYDVLLVADEVICGFGRTGQWFGCQTFDFQPDILSMAKGLSSGYLPISAVAVGDRIADTLTEHCGDFNHGFTYSGHPAAAAVALENIRLLRDEGVIESVATDTGPYLQSRLRGVIGEHPLCGHIEGIGLIAGLALVKDRQSRTFFDGDVGTVCRDECTAAGLIARACGNRIVLSPPLVISREEIDAMVDRLRIALDRTYARVSGLSDA